MRLETFGELWNRHAMEITSDLRQENVHWQMRCMFSAVTRPALNWAPPTVLYQSIYLQTWSSIDRWLCEPTESSPRGRIARSYC